MSVADTMLSTSYVLLHFTNCKQLIFHILIFMKYRFVLQSLRGKEISELNYYALFIHKLGCYV